MSLHAIVVAEAAGPPDVSGAVLTEAGFQVVSAVPSFGAAQTLRRQREADLLVVPLDGPAAVPLTALSSALERGGPLVIATAAALEPDLLLRAMRAGVHEFLAAPTSREELAAAVDRLKRRLRPDGGGELTVAVYCAKGGMGTSTVAVNLAYQFAAMAPTRRTVLADFVVSGGDVGLLLNQHPAFDIGDLTLKLEQIDGSLLETVLTTGPGGLRVLAASESPEALELVDGRAASAILADLRAWSSHVVVDCEHYLTDRTVAALDVADKVVLVTQLNVPAVRSTQRTVSLCRRLGIPDERLLIVANRWQASDVISSDDAAKAIDHPVLARIPNDFRTVEAAQTRGLPVSAENPLSPIARAYATLARTITGTDEPEPRRRAPAPAAPAVAAGGGGNRFGRLLGFGRK